MAIPQTIARFIYGGRMFDVNDQIRFIMAEDFTLPATENSLNLTGPIANSGGQIVGKQGKDRRWGFNLLAIGSSATQVEKAISELQAFLNLAGQGGETMYFEFSITANIPYRPIWGQAGWFRYEVKHGQVTQMIPSGYTSSAKKKNITSVSLLIGPHKLGLDQQMAYVTGGIWEDDLFSPNVRGTVVLPVVTNKFTNPVFQYKSNYLQGWTKSANLDVYLRGEQNESALFGDAALYVVKPGGGTTATLTQSITATVAAYTISLYARRKDRDTIDAGIVRVWYNGVAQTTNFVALKDGWYRVWATFTGVAAAAVAGIDVTTTGIMLSVTGFQFEEGSTPSPFIYGDMAGCSWDGERHNSISGSSGDLELPAIDTRTGTARLAFRWYYASTHGSNQYFFGSSGSWALYYQASDDKLYFVGSASISTAALTFNAGDLCVIHLVYGVNYMKIYVNGVEAASGTGNYAGSNTPLPVGNDTGGSHSAATLLDITFWDRKATADQVLADYNEIYAHISAGDGWGKRLSAIPWRWHYDAHFYPPGSMDEYIDATHSDYMAIGGIDGDVPAITDIVFDLTNIANGSSVLMALNSYIKPISVKEEFLDLNGTAWAGSLGGVLQQSVNNTPEVFFPASGDLDILNLGKAYYGKTAYLVFSAADAGANLTARMRCMAGAGFVVYSDYKMVVGTASLKKFIVGPILIPVTIPGVADTFDAYGEKPQLTFALGFVRTAAGAANVSVDYYRLIVGKVLYLDVQNASSNQVRYISNKGVAGMSSADYIIEKPIMKGDLIELEPNQYNYLYATPGDLDAVTDYTKYMDVTSFIVTPRWSML